MADYAPPAVPEKRTRFFDGQFLVDQDFVDEQNYHLDRLRRHQRLLHVSGIADGLPVSSAAGYTVTVGPGTAVDAGGRTLALAAAVDVALPADRFTATAGAVVHLAYREQSTDQQKGQGSADDTRWLERPTVVVLRPGESWDGTTPTVPLATITVDNRGSVSVDPGVRHYTGVRLPGPGADAAALRGTPNGGITLSGADGSARLTVSAAGRVGIGTDPAKEPVQTLSVNGGLYLQNGVVQYGGSAVTATSDLGLYSQYSDAWIRLVTTQAPIRLFTDGGVGTKHRLTVEADGKVGVGVDPKAWLDVTGSGDARSSTTALMLRSGNATGGGGSGVQLAFGCNGDALYRHHIRSRHDFGTATGNALDFYVWSPTPTKDPDGVATRHALTLDGGHVGIGTTTPSNSDGLDRVVDVVGAASGNLTVRGSSVEGRVTAHDKGIFGSGGPGMIVGTKSGHGLYLATAGATRLTVSQNGFVGVGTTTDPERALTVQSDGTHVLLRRPASTEGGTKTFLELRQDDTSPAGTPEVSPSILFYHATRFWNRIECGSDGFHLRWGPSGGDHANLAVSDMYVYGRLCYRWNNLWKQVQNPSGNTTNSYNLDPQPAAPSDARLKTAVRPITGALESVRALRGLRYRWGEAGLEHLTRDVADSVSAGPGAGDDEHRRVRDAEVARARAALDGDDLGFLAQDVERVVPELVRDGEDGYKYLRYTQLTALLVEAVKEQQEIIERLTGRVEALGTGRGN